MAQNSKFKDNPYLLSFLHSSGLMLLTRSFWLYFQKPLGNINLSGSVLLHHHLSPKTQW